MTAFGFKQHGVDTISKENPWGALLPSGILAAVIHRSPFGQVARVSRGTWLVSRSSSRAPRLPS